MKSQIKKGYKKKKEKPHENYNVRFNKLIDYIMIWRHYILTYYKEREQRFYEKLYKQSLKGQRVVTKVESNDIGTISQKDLTESLDQGPFDKHPTRIVLPVSEDNFHRINITFFIDEFFLYILEILHSTASLAYM